jgi:uncharacterized membrane protein YecN with MAPEG domain
MSSLQCASTFHTAVRVSTSVASLLFIKCFVTALIQGTKKGLVGKGGALGTRGPRLERACLVLLLTAPTAAADLHVGAHPAALSLSPAPPLACAAASEDSVVHNGKAQGFAAVRKPDSSSIESSGVNLVSSDAEEAAARWERILGNDVENIPLAMAVTAISLLGISVSSSGMCFGAFAHTIALSIYTVGRLLHTTFYACSIQPGRTLIFALSQFSMVFLCINGLVASFN